MLQKVAIKEDALNEVPIAQVVEQVTVEGWWFDSLSAPVSMPNILGQYITLCCSPMDEC